MLEREPRAPDWEEDMRAGLEIIESRAEGLNAFHAVLRAARPAARTRR